MPISCVTARVRSSTTQGAAKPLREIVLLVMALSGISVVVRSTGSRPEAQPRDSSIRARANPDPIRIAILMTQSIARGALRDMLAEEEEEERRILAMRWHCRHE